MADSILLIDDDVAILRAFGAFFESQGWEVFRELTGEAGLTTFERTIPEVVLVDLHLPGIDALEVLEQLRGRDTAVLVMTGDDHVPTAVQAIRLGAENFLIKPVDLAHLHAAADRAAEKVRLRRINRTLIGHGTEHHGLEVLGTSPPMKALRARITQLARSDASGVLILGETGTGKRRVARLIHDLSLRADEAYIEATAATDDPQAFENSVFGIEGDGAEGMVTSQGLIGISDRGSLQLSNITAAPLATQSRLEQALENHAYRRNGSSREVPVDIRLLASTTEEPDSAREHGRFEEALYYRLKPMSLTVPPIRQMGRNDQIAILARELAAVARSAPGAPTRFTDEALERLLSHPWPGNFREVRALLERATMQARGREEVGLEHFPAELRSRPGGFDRRHTPLTIEEVERMHIERTLKHHKGNRTRAAQELGISRATLITKIRRYAIPL